MTDVADIAKGLSQRQLYALKQYIDIRVEWIVNRELSRQLPPAEPYVRAEHEFDAIMMGTAP